MRKYLVATHCSFAHGIKSSVEYIIGEQKTLDAINAYEEDDFDLSVAIDKKLSELSGGDELIVLTDLLGGSVNNEFMLNLKDPRVYLVTGVNLPLMLDLLTVPPEMPVQEAISGALLTGKEGMVFCNNLREESIEPEEDF